MADVKISALPLASTPLAGTEVLPIVQSATTDQVSVANLTAGRAVSASSLTLTGSPLPIGSGGTNASSFTTSQVTYFDGTRLVGSANLTFNGTNLTGANDAFFNGVRVGEGGGAIATNTAVGASALAANTTGANNTAVGANALDVNTTGSLNSVFGSGALGANLTGNQNSAFGYNAANLVSTATNVSAFGFIAAQVNTANGICAIGAQSLERNTTGVENVAVGSGYLTFSTLGQNLGGSRNTAVGNGAMRTNVSGNNNTALGYEALQLSTASNLTAVGYQALFSNTTGAQNTAVGYVALANFTTGSNNTALGHSAGSGAANATSSDNTLIGYAAGNSISTGTGRNVAVGSLALQFLTSNIDNVAVGYQTLGGSTNTGSRNTAIGGGQFGVLNSAGYSITSGSSNTLIGAASGNTITTGSGCVIIGFNAQSSSASSSNDIVVGQAVTSAGSGYVTFGNGTNRVWNVLDGSTTTWSVSSDERFKTNIQPNDLGLKFINLIKPVKFQWKPNYEVPKELYTYYREENDRDIETMQEGLIAQNVQAAMEACGVENFSGFSKQIDGSLAIGLGEFVLPLINAVKELSAQVEELKKRVK